MGAFHVFKIVQMIPNRANHLNQPINDQYSHYIEISQQIC